MRQDTLAPTPSRPTRRRRWLRALVVLVVAAALAGGAVWLVRDAPRRWVERRLAAALDADVRLAALEIEGLHDVVLHGVEVRQPAWEPRLEAIEIERVTVHGSLRDALAQRYARLSVEGVDVRLVPPTRPATPLPPSALRVGRVEVRRGRIVATSGREETELDFTATLDDWGGTPTGHVSIGARRLDASPLLAVAGMQGPARVAAERLRVEIELPAGPDPVRIEFGAAHLRVQLGARVYELREPAVEVTATRDATRQSLRVELRPIVAGIDAIALNAELDATTFALRSGRAELRGVDLAALREHTVSRAEGWTVDGRADLLIHTEDGDTFEYETRIDVARVEVEVDRTTIGGERISGSARGVWSRRVDAQPAVAPSFAIDATLGSLRASGAGTDVHVRRSRLVSSGTLDTTGGDLRLKATFSEGSGQVAHRQVPAELFPLVAAFDGTLQLAERPDLTGRTELHSPALGRLRIDGRTLLDRDRPAAQWRWSWSEAPGLDALQRTAGRLGIDSIPDGLELRGRPKAHGTLDGELSDPAATARLTIEPLELRSIVEAPGIASGTWTLATAAAHADLSRATGVRGRIGLDAFEAEGTLRHVPDGDPGPDTGTHAWAVSARGGADVGIGTLQLERARIELPGVAALELQGRIEPDLAAAVSARLEPVALARVRELTRTWIADPFPEYALEGHVTSRFDLERSPAGPWRLTGGVDLVDAGFGSEDGAHVVQGVAAHWNVAAASGPDGGIDGTATTAPTGPLLLWGTLFGDFSRLDSLLAVRARRTGGLWTLDADWNLPHGVGVRGRFAERAAPADRLDYTVSAAVPDLSLFLEHYVRAPFEGSVEHIDTLRASGRLGVELGGTLDEAGRSVTGSITASHASFAGIEGATAIAGLELSLPVDLAWGVAPHGTHELLPGAEQVGALAYDELLLGGLQFPPLDTALIVASDTVRFARALDLALLDGRVELSRLALTGWTRADRHLRFGLSLDGLSLAALSRSLGTFPLDGSLNGTFPAVRLTQDRLEVDGGGTIAVFGGAVEVFDISGEQILSRFPRLQFSARLDDVHLLDVTRTFDFGEIYGVVNGQIRDCELFGGVPLRCEARLESVKTRGVPQKISVKAIRNISILGSGPRVGFLDRGLQKFFDTYTYSRLGLTMKLNQDRFLLRGTERRGRRELFVKGRLPFRIDIVNAAPGQTVSFQTMMGRLQNLEVAAPVRKGAR